MFILWLIWEWGHLFPTSTFTYNIDIYDKDLGKSIPVPNTSATIPVQNLLQ